MLEVRRWKKSGRVELVSDDSNAENSIVADALDFADDERIQPVAQRWDEAEFADGELVIEIKKEEVRPVAEVLAPVEFCADAAATLYGIAKEEE